MNLQMLAKNLNHIFFLVTIAWVVQDTVGFHLFSVFVLTKMFLVTLVQQPEKNTTKTCCLELIFKRQRCIILLTDEWSNIFRSNGMMQFPVLFGVRPSVIQVPSPPKVHKGHCSFAITNNGERLFSVSSFRGPFISNMVDEVRVI